MANQAIFHFVDLEESEASMGLHLPASLSLPDSMQMALDFSSSLEALSDCFIETIEIIQSVFFSGGTATATREETEIVRALIFSTTNGNVIITLPAYNGGDMTALIAELLSGNQREIISETNGEPIQSFLLDYDMLIPFPESIRSG